MNAHVLQSREDAASVLANLFRSCFGRNSRSTLQLELEVSEDKCFKEEQWVSIGRITVHPELPDASGDETSDRDLLLNAFRYGFFDWELPAQNTLQEAIISALSGNDNQEEKDNQKEKMEKNIKESTKAIAHVAIRCGLAHPVFDAMSLAQMPFRRPVSVVVDTTAVIQGGLDFLARHLTPAVRIKVPALVHMEILNRVERYFTRRNKVPQRITRTHSANMLLDHILSQGGQRALLRLEMDRQVEFERPRLGADPLRGIVQPDSDAEDKQLGLQRIQKSFADRLILETAIQHRDRVDPDHPVMLMTSDQGLARMALAEGIGTIFFDSNSVSHLFDDILSGITFAPFATNNHRFSSSSLLSLLWECAVTFGSARLASCTDEITFEVVSIGENVAWQPFHSYEDLLWTRKSSATKQSAAAQIPSEGETVSFRSPPLRNKNGRNDDTGEKRKREITPRSLTGAYSFNSISMLNLMVKLENSGSLSDEEGLSITRVKTDSAYSQYYKFLLAGHFADRKHSRLIKTNLLDQLMKTVREKSYVKLNELLIGVPSFRQFSDKLTLGDPLTREASGIRTVAFPTYCTLAELCCVGVRFAEDGIYGTPRNPTPADFVSPALRAYEQVRAGEDFALTGDWLECLVKRFGVHPVYARQRLSEAHQGGYLRRYFEGSTPETRYENRNIHVLEIDGETPIIWKSNLYYGDFLMPGRASVGIKLSPGEHK